VFQQKFIKEHYAILGNSILQIKLTLQHFFLIKIFSKEI